MSNLINSYSLSSVIGIGTDTPNQNLTVVGGISGNALVYDQTGNSSQWNTAYNIATTYQSASGSFATNTLLQSTSALLTPLTTTNTLTGLLTPLTTTNTLTGLLVKTTDLNTLSATLLTRTDANTLSSLLVTNTAFSNYQTNIASATATLLPTTVYQNASGNWQSTYTTVSANSANWNTAYRSVSSQPYTLVDVTSSINTVRGTNNTASGNYSSILGGVCNTASGNCSTVVGGKCNTASGACSTASGYCSNVSSGAGASNIGGGVRNRVTASCSSVLGGCFNCSTASYSSVLGGKSNTASGIYSFIAGGSANDTKGFSNTFILGTSLSATQANTTYVNNIAVLGNTNTTATLNTSPLTIAAAAAGSIFNSIQNTYSGLSASTDISLYNNDNVNYLDIGINSIGYNGNLYGPIFNVVGAGDSYVYSTANNLAVGAASNTGNITFFTGGTQTSNERMRINSSGNVGIGTTTPNTNLTVVGNISASNNVTTSTITVVSAINTPGINVSGTGQQVVLSDGVNNTGNGINTLALNFTGGVFVNSKLSVNNAVGSATSGSIINKFPIYNAAGTLIGYIPIYSS